MKGTELWKDYNYSTKYNRKIQLTLMSSLIQYQISIENYPHPNQIRNQPTTISGTGLMIKWISRLRGYSTTIPN